MRVCSPPFVPCSPQTPRGGPEASTSRWAFVTPQRPGWHVAARDWLADGWEGGRGGPPLHRLPEARAEVARRRERLVHICEARCLWLEWAWSHMNYTEAERVAALEAVGTAEGVDLFDRIVQQVLPTPLPSSLTPFSVYPDPLSVRWAGGLGGGEG